MVWDKQVPAISLTEPKYPRLQVFLGLSVFPEENLYFPYDISILRGKV